MYKTFGSTNLKEILVRNLKEILVRNFVCPHMVDSHYKIVVISLCVFKEISFISLSFVPYGKHEDQTRQV